MNEFNYEGWIGSVLDNYASVSEFPAEGSENTLYIVRDGGQAQLYVWDSETYTYIEFAGGGGGGTDHGIPSGGTTGQVLAKTSDTDYDVEWVDQSGGGGGSSIEEVSLEELFGSVIPVTYADADGEDHTFVIKSDENGNTPTVADFKDALENYLDTEAAAASMFEDNYLIFNLFGRKVIEPSGGRPTASESIPLQVNYEIKNYPETGDSYLVSHVYSLRVVLDNNELKVAPEEASGPISGFVRIKISD